MSTGIDLSCLNDLGDIDPSGGVGQYFEPGKYLVRCDRVELKKGHRGTSAIGTNTIMHVWHTEDASIVPGESNRNVVENLTGPNAKIAKANLKAYLLALCEGMYAQKIDPRAVNAAFVIPIVGAANPIGGTYAICEAVRVPKVSKPTEFIVKKSWSPIGNAELAHFGLVQPVPRQ